jgi:EAL domain-containing protein (putative c-di-GMP-specific phosphodiesterase class I)
MAPYRLLRTAAAGIAGRLPERLETPEALRWPRERGCERVQGFYISPPIPSEKFVEWVRGYAAGATQRGCP